MRTMLTRALVMFCVLAMTAAGGRSQDGPPPPPPPGGTDLPGPIDPPPPPPPDGEVTDLLQPTGNKVDVTATSPQVGVFKADGTLTAGAGWKADGVKLVLKDGQGKQVGQPVVIAGGNNFSHKFENLPAGSYLVEAEGLFRKDKMADRPTAKAGVTVR